MSATPTLVLVDGSSYLYRAFHALPPLSNSRGEPTGAVYGVLNMLQKLLREQTPQLVGIVFDAPGKTFRDELFAQYKAQRAPMPDELRPQLEPLLAAVAGLGLPLLRVSGVEADDVIGTLARRAARQGLRVVISTGDKDMAQLVDERTTLVNTMTGAVLDRSGVKTKFDVYPEQIIDYLALVGDSSDNIPGVPKVGPKTAAKWLAEYGTLDNLLAHASDIPGKAGENLRANLAAVELSRRLATINCEVTLDIAPENLRPAPADVESLRALYQRLELNSLLRQLPPAAPALEADRSVADNSVADGAAASITERQYETLFTDQDLARWLQTLGEAPLFSFNLLASSADYMHAQIVGVSFAVAPGRAAYVPLEHRYAGVPDQLDSTQVLQALRPLLEDGAREKVGHNSKFQMHLLHRHGIELAHMRYDSMLESYVFNSTATRHDIAGAARKYLGLETTPYETLCGRGAKQIAFDQVPLEAASLYASEEADTVLKLHEFFWPKICAIAPLKALYQDIELPLAAVLARMERHGVPVDRAMLRRQSTELAERMRELQAQAHAEAGTPFNLDSPKQLQDILFGKLQLPVLRRTPKGQPSTAEDVLEEMAASYALPQLILEYRAVAKLKSTYTDKLPEQIDPHTGRIHTSYHQAVAATGRLSSADPNLQNIPIRNPEGRRIRQAFIAPSGAVLMAADYSQIELRIMAHLSGDEGLLRAFAEDRDIHQATAAEVFAVAPEAVTPEQRRAAKAINFGLIYGMSAFGLARQLGIERGAAQRYVDLYFERYPGVKRFMDQTRRQAREQGFVETVFGRRLYLPDINARNAQLRQYAERSAINAPMQGTAADIIKRAMIEVDGWILRAGAPAKLIMQVHDELVLEVAEDAAREVARELRRQMCAAAELRIPLKVEVGIGANWDEAH